MLKTTKNSIKENNNLEVVPTATEHLPQPTDMAEILKSLQIVLENTEESFLAVDTNLRVLICNTKYRKGLLHYFQENIYKGAYLPEVLSPERAEKLKKIYEKILQGETFEDESTIMLDDGLLHTYVTKYKPFYDTQQKIIGAFSSSFNITAIKNAQLQLQISEQRYRSIIENSHHAFIFSTLDGTILSTNKRASEIFGYSAEEFQAIGRKGMVVYDDEYYITMAGLQPDSQTLEGELTGIRKNGELFPYEFTSVIYDDLEGEKKACTFITDISKRKSVEKALARSEKRFRALVENAGDIIILTNTEGKVTYVSPAYEKLTDFKAQEVIGQLNINLIHSEQAAEIQETVFPLILANPGLSVPRQNRLLKKNGEYVWVEGIVTNLLQDENVRAIVSNYHNITERKEAEAKIKLSESNLKAIFDNSSEAFILLDANLNIKAFNNRAKIFTFLNRDKEIEIGEPVFDFVADDRKDILEDFFTRTLKGENIQYERSYVQENGDTIWIDYSFNPVIEATQIKGICISGRDITENKKAALELLKKESRFRSLIENSHDMLALLNPEEQIEYISPSVERTLGYKNEDIHGRAVNEVIYAEDLESIKSRLEDVYKNMGLQTHVTVRCRHRNGNYVWVEGEVTNMLMVEGVNAIAVNFRDVSQRKYFEDQRALLVSIINSSEDAISSITADGIITSWNRGAEKLFGYTDREVIGQSINTIVPEEKLEEEREILEKIKNGIQIENYETQRKKKNGEIIYVSLTLSIIRDSMGVVTGAAKIARNITEKKEAEDKIRYNEMRFRSLLQNSADGLSLLDAQGFLIYISNTGKKILGYNDTELIGSLRDDLIHPEDLPTVSEIYTEVIASPNLTRNLEYRIRMSDGSYKWLESTCHNLLQDPAVGAVVLNYRDITERKLQEIEREKLIETLHQNNDDLRHFSYITSHNLKAPLSNLIGFLNLTDDMKIENPHLSKILDGMKKSTGLLNDTISDLVKILIIRENNSIELKEISFYKIFSQVSAQLENLITEVKPSITLDFTAAPKVLFNETYLESIFMNLLTNAIKYRDYKRGLKIELKSEDTGEYIMLSFKDNGIGLDTERNKDKLFRLYQRFHDRPNSKGMGLYLVKTQMESLGGSISVESKINISTNFILKFKK